MNDNILNTYINDLCVSMDMVSRLSTNEQGHPEIRYFTDYILIFQVTIDVPEIQILVEIEHSSFDSLNDGVSLYLICQVNQTYIFCNS